MDGSWFNDTLAWIGDHPVAAGGVIFLIAFLDALVVVGILVPALPLLIAVGVLVGLGHVDGTYAVACAALGAFTADTMGYAVGRRWGPGIRSLWPFSRYPQLIDRGERLFRRHGVKSLLVARFVGPIRPFLPATAGMLRMPVRRYVATSAVVAVVWASVSLAPGWLLGASYDAVAAVADRLLLVLVALAAVVGLVWACVVYTYRWFDDHANQLLARALRWTREHPRLGRYAGALIDPNRPESASLAILAVCLIGIGWAWFALMTTALMRGEPLAVDRTVYEAMLTLRTPLADRLMAGLASIGDPAVLVPAAGLAMGWLLWRRRWMAAAHWAAALAFGLALTALLEAVIRMPAPPTAHSGFSFPSFSVTMTTITFGFFAVLIARELPGRSRVWPYMVAGVLAALLGFARLYLGAHWLSDVVGGMLLGIVWLLALGIAYRRHVSRSFWMRPLALIFYTTFAVAALWHAPRAVDPMLASFAPPPPATTMTADHWWHGGWRDLPPRRNERDRQQRWPLDVQVAGRLAPLQAHLQAHGWTVQPQAGWIDTLGLLNDDTPPAEQPVLPATLDTEAEALLMRRQVSEQRAEVLRLWRAPARLDDGTPLWVGTVQTLDYDQHFGLLGLWQPRADDHAAWYALRETLLALDAREGAHPESGLPVIRIRIREIAFAD